MDVFLVKQQDAPKQESPKRKTSFKPKGDDEADKLIADFLKETDLDVSNLKIQRLGKAGFLSE